MEFNQKTVDCFAGRGVKKTQWIKTEELPTESP